MPCIKCGRQLEPEILARPKALSVGLCTKCRWWIPASKLAELEAMVDHQETMKNIAESLSMLPSLLVSAKRNIDLDTKERLIMDDEQSKSDAFDDDLDRDLKEFYDDDEENWELGELPDV